MQIGTRLGLGFASGIALLAAIAAVGVSRIGAVIDNTNLILYDRYVKVSLTHAIENDVNAQAIALRTALIATDIKTVENELTKVEAAEQQVDQSIESLHATIRSPQDLDALNALTRARKEYLTRKAELVRLAAVQSLDEGGVYLNNVMFPAQVAYLSAINVLARTQEDGMRTFGEEATATVRRARIVMIGLPVLAVFLAAMIGIALTRSITIPISRAVEVAQRVASGDLTTEVEIRNSDETGQLLRAVRDMNQGLSDIVREVRKCSESIAAGATQIASGSADFTKRTEEQATWLQQATFLMDDISAMGVKNAGVANTAAAMAEQARAIATQGGELVRQVVATMADIAASSRKISEITSVIDGIASQSNILALNASVEASRAGEVGRGFAVVAAEVRTLAQRTTHAAREIQDIVQTSADKVEAGSGLVGRAGATMQTVVEQAHNVAQLISEIDAATQGHASRVSGVRDAVSQLDHMMRKNAALVGQSAAAAENLSQQAERLTGLVGAFKLSQVHGASMD